MSVLLAQALLGVLLGLALRLRPRHLPFAVLLAVLPDVDVLLAGVPGVTARATLHNAFVAIALPLAAYAALRARGAPAAWRRFALASPALLTAHVLVDVIPFTPGAARGHVAFLWPVADTRFGLAFFQIRSMDPLAFSSFTILVVLLCAIVLLTWAAFRVLEADDAERARPVDRVRVAAVVAAWALLFPALAAGGVLVTGPAAVDATFTLDAPAAHVVDGRFTATVTHGGGEDAAPGHLVVDVRRGSEVLARAVNPTPLTPGDAWSVDAPLPVAPEDAKGLEARLRMRSEAAPVTYAEARVRVDEGYLAADVAIAAFEHDGEDRGRVTLANAGNVPVPAGAMRVRVSDESGRVVGNATVTDRLTAGGDVTVTMDLPFTVITDRHVVEARAVGFDRVLAQETMTATPRPGTGTR